jgi:outer membrane protein OmpA-like peptidoglycan-associated protein
MTKKRVILGIVSMGLYAAFATGCQAEAKLGNPEVKAATPPPVEPAPPPPPVVEAPKPADPPPAPKALGRVAVQDNKIVISEQIQFDKAGATIKPESSGLLDEIAKAIKENDAKIKKVEVAGHTSSEGDASANMKLSSDRAAAVLKALTERGVDKAKLVSKGYGVTKPIGDNADAGGRVKNRRVEFTILDK